MKINKYYIVLLLTLMSLSFVFNSCETTNLDLQDDPNTLDPSQISIHDGLNGLQVNFVRFFENSQIIGGELTRENYMFGSTYQNAMPPGTGGRAWDRGYSDILLDSKVILDKIQNDGISAPLHVGVMHAMRAYVLMTLVDYWGDVPYSEALGGVDNFNPNVDSGSQVYDVALDELNSAKVSLEDALANLDSDGNVINTIPGGSEVLKMFFENASTEGELAGNWMKFVNSLKFKYFLNIGDVAELNNLIAENNMISSNIDNCAFRYSTVNSPESRHPAFVNNYVNNTSDYMSNSLMYKMVLHPDNPNPDPRGAYYFYRQTLTFPGPNDNPSLNDALPCSSQASPYPPGVAFCAFGDGYWGRDHGDADGIPPDSDKRTTWGAYPAGGLVDSGQGSSVSEDDGLKGAGVSPVLMSFQVYLLRAEAALRLGTNDNAASMLLNAMSKSISYVTSFDGSAPEAGTTYKTNVMNAFNAATTIDEKMQIIAEQMWIASFGSGTEMYNMYRRTGFPNNLQPHLLGTGAGEFPRSLFYPNNTADLNTNINQKPNLTESVFWADPSISLY